MFKSSKMLKLQPNVKKSKESPRNKSTARRASLSSSSGVKSLIA